MQFITLFICLFVLSGCAAPMVESTKNSNQEQLNFRVPQNWKIGHQAQDGKQAILELIPNKETVEDWTRMVTIQAYEGPQQYEPETFLNGMGELAKKTCADSAIYPVINSTQNGYPFSQKVIFCKPKDSTKPSETINIKAIKGKNQFYVAQFARRVQISEEEARFWAFYMRDVQVETKSR